MVESTRGTVESVEEVKKEIKKHFKDFFKESCSVRPIPKGIEFRSLEDRDKIELEIPFTVEEVKYVSWSCDGNKNPGPNGYTLVFFKKNWALVKEDVIRFFSDFHLKAKLTKACTSSFITLIPKVANHHLLLEYRPICLVGSLYKILSKVLAAKLKGVIGKLILVKRSSFIHHRNILDDILMANEVINLSKREQRSCLVLKVDYEKAYNSVS